MENLLFQYLPEEILREILLNLPSKSLCRFLAVCKSWHTLITSQPFISSHLNQNLKTKRNTHLLVRLNYNIDQAGEIYDDIKDKGDIDDEFLFYPYNQTNKTILGVPSFALKPPPNSRYRDSYFTFYMIIGICNGLVCLKSNYSETSCCIILWNPSIKKFVTLPEYSIIDLPRSVKWIEWYAYGFGTNLLDNDYKVVRILVVRGRDNTLTMLAEVYSLRTREWRKIKGGNNIPSSCFRVHMNGRCHFLGHKSEKHMPFLFSFDMSDEMFREVVSLPKQILEEDEHANLISLTTISRERECLAIIYYVFKGRDEWRSYQIWVMNEYGVSESWNNLYNIDMGLYSMDMWSSNKFDFAQLRESVGILEMKTEQLTLHDIEDGSLTNLNIHRLPARPTYGDTYVESLVLL